MIEYKSVSLANQVFERIEYNILSGEYAIGEIISEKRLAAELGVSRTPIREAAVGGTACCRLPQRDGRSRYHG